MSYWDSNNEEYARSRLEESPLSSLIPPSYRLKPLTSPSGSNSPKTALKDLLLPENYLYLRAQLNETIKFIYYNQKNRAKPVEIEQICQLIESEIGSYRALGVNYMKEVAQELEETPETEEPEEEPDEESEDSTEGTQKRLKEEWTE